MEILGTFGIQSTFYFPLIDRGTLDLAVSADYTPANADCRLSKDGGSWAVATNTIADETEGWSLTLTATEMGATRIHVNIIDAATKSIEDQSLIIHTGLTGLILGSNGTYVITCDNATFTPTTTAAEFTMVSPNLNEEATADHFKGRLLLGVGSGDATQAAMTDITASVLANSKVKLTFTALQEAPPNTSTWIIV